MPESIANLFQNAIKLSSNRKSPSDSPNIRIEKIIPFLGVKTILFQISMRGVTQYPIRHRVNILAKDISMAKTEIPNSFKYEENFIEKPSTRQPVFFIRCTCHDFYFTWGIWNFFKNCLFGNKPRPYKRKTPPPPKGYPYRNPLKIHGMCKHVYWAIKALEQKGYMR